jgi:hypothetical protein
MAPFTKALKKGLNDLQAATMWLVQNAMANPDNAGAASTDYMHLFGLVSLGYMWGMMAKAAQDKLAAGAGDVGLLREQARHRALNLHGAPDARNLRAPRAYLVGRGFHDGAAGDGVLRVRNLVNNLLGPAGRGRSSSVQEEDQS